MSASSEEHAHASPPIERRAAGSAAAELQHSATIREPAALYKSSPSLRPFRSAEAVPPMRVDTFGDLVALAPEEAD